MAHDSLSVGGQRQDGPVTVSSKEKDAVNYDEYQKLAHRTECDPEQPRLRITGLFQSETRSICTPTRLIHAMSGMVTEVGELAELLEASLFHDQALDLEHVDEEVGDLLWYVALYHNARGLTMPVVGPVNVSRDRPYTHVLMLAAVAVGGLVDVLKRHWFYGKEMDTGKADRCSGELLGLVASYALVRGVSVGRLMAANIAKLRARYPQKFTEHDALNRDLGVEKNAALTTDRAGRIEGVVSDPDFVPYHDAPCPACDHDHPPSSADVAGHVEQARLSDDGNPHDPVCHNCGGRVSGAACPHCENANTLESQ